MLFFQIILKNDIFGPYLLCKIHSSYPIVFFFVVVNILIGSRRVFLFALWNHCLYLGRTGFTVNVLLRNKKSIFN